MLIVVCTSFALVAYVYFGYAALLRAGALGKRRESRHASLNPLPFISVIVPAHNEEASIAAKIENLLASGYPRERLDILIGSDGSSDHTEEIVQRYAGEGVGLVSFPQQHGKSAIQNGLVALASGEILVFTDADCTFAPGALTALIDRFADPAVGLVTARPIFDNSSETSVTHNEGIYLRYETWLRQQESARGLLALASGSLFAIRRELWQPLDVTMGDDFALPLHVAQRGFRNVLEPHAIAITRLTQNAAASMFKMKVRIIAKDFRALIANRHLLNPFRYGGIAVALWSHKLLRWLVPYFLLAILAGNFFLLDSPTFRAAIAPQLVFYVLALRGILAGGESRRTIASIPASFCIVNAAALVGTLNCLMGKTFSRWAPTRSSALRSKTSLQSRRART